MFCLENQVRTSVGRTGVCWDNAAAESVFASLKNKMYHRYTFATRTRARFAVADYIEVFYNRRRLPRTIPPTSPVGTPDSAHDTGPASGHWATHRNW